MFEIETFAVVGSDAEAFDGGIMLLGGIAHVVVPAILRIFLGNAAHILIAVRFRQNRRGSNAHHLSVALHDGLIGRVAIGLKLVAIDQNKLRAHLELVERTVHRQNRGVENVDAVDFFWPHMRHSPRQRLLLNHGAQQIALPLGELLAVVDNVVVKIGGQNHRGGGYRTHERSTTSLIAPGFDSSLN